MGWYYDGENEYYIDDGNGKNMSAPSLPKTGSGVAPTAANSGGGLKWDELLKYAPQFDDTAAVAHQNAVNVPGIGQVFFGGQAYGGPPTYAYKMNPDGSQVKLEPNPDGTVKNLNFTAEEVRKGSENDSWISKYGWMVPLGMAAGIGALGGQSAFGGAAGSGAAGGAGGLTSAADATAAAANAAGYSVAPGYVSGTGALEAAVGNAAGQSLVPGSLASGAAAASAAPNFMSSLPALQAASAVSSLLKPTNGMPPAEQAPAPVEERTLSNAANTASGAKSLADLSKPITEWGVDDWLSALGKAAPGLIGAYASSEQAGALSDLAKQQMDAESSRYDDLVRRETDRFNELKAREDAAIARQRGDIEYGRTQTQPYRSRLSDLYANPDSFLTSNEVTKPVQMGTDMLARSLSVGGNPIGSGNALQQLQSYSADQLFSRLGEEKNRLGTLGGMGSFGQSGATVPGIGSSLPSAATAGSGVGYNAGSNMSLASLGSDANVWNALGSAANNVFTPQKSLAEQLAELKRAGVF